MKHEDLRDEAEKTNNRTKVPLTSATENAQHSEDVCDEP